MENGERVLSDRKKQILKAIVDAHIVDGEPVGSLILMDVSVQRVGDDSACSDRVDGELLSRDYVAAGEDVFFCCLQCFYFLWFPFPPVYSLPFMLEIFFKWKFLVILILGDLSLQ